MENVCTTSAFFVHLPTRKTLIMHLLKTTFAIAALCCLSSLAATAQIITTIAGDKNGDPNANGIEATEAKLNNPWGIAVDNSGNVYFTEPSKHRVRKIDADGAIYTIAGNGAKGYSGDRSPATNAQLNTPYGVAVDKVGNVYIADYGNNRIRKVSPEGIISTYKNFANKPLDLAIDTAGNLLVAEDGAMTVSKTTAAGVSNVVISGFDNTLSGGYCGVTSDLWMPENGRLNGLTFDNNGNVLIVDHWDNLIRKVTPTGILSTICGAHPNYASSGDGGPAGLATLNSPRRIASDKEGNIYISDGTVRKINRAGIISTVAGGGTGHPTDNNIMATDASLYAIGIATDDAGNLYLADTYYGTIRKVRPGNVGVTNVTPNCGIHLYPNPNNGLFVFTASYAEPISGVTHIAIANAAGAVVYTADAETKNTTVTKSIDITNLPSGVYFLKAMAGSQVVNTVFEIQ